MKKRKERTHRLITRRPILESLIENAEKLTDEEIKNEWDGVTHDYTIKEKVLVKNIILPDHIPKEFNDRVYLME